MSGGTKHCETCGAAFSFPDRPGSKRWATRRYCSSRCRAAASQPCPEHVKESLRARTGAANHNWTGGLTITAGGYLMFTASPANGEHAGRYLHQVIAEHKIGRRLRHGEHVHHLDENKLNNDPANIDVMPAEDHARLHSETNHFWETRN